MRAAQHFSSVNFILSVGEHTKSSPQFWKMLLRLSPKIKRKPSKRKQLLKDRSHFLIFMCRLCTAGTRSPAEGPMINWGKRTFLLLTQKNKCQENATCTGRFDSEKGYCVQCVLKGSFSKIFYLWKSYQVPIFAWGCSSSWDQRSKPPSSIWEENWSWLKKMEMCYWCHTVLKGSKWPVVIIQNINPSYQCHIAHWIEPACFKLTVKTHL